MRKYLCFAAMWIGVFSATAQEPAAEEVQDAPQQSHELNEVVVTEAPVVREAGKESYIITPELRKGTMSAAQLMERLSGFVVDPVSRSVSIGKDKDVAVVVNEKPVTHEFAMSLNPERIKRVEVLRFPTGRFSGTPILINIVLNSNYVGTDGSLWGSANAILNGSASNSEGVAANVISTFGRWSLYGTAQLENELSYSANGYELHAGEVAEEVFERPTPSQSNMRMRQTGEAFVAGADYRLGERHTLTAQTLLIVNDAKSRLRTNHLNINPFDTRSSVTSIFYQGRATDKLSINGELTYNYYDINDRHYFREPDGTELSSSHMDGTKNYVNANAGAAYSINDHWNVMAHYGYTWRDYDNRRHGAETTSYYFEEQRHRPTATMSYSDNRRLSVRASLGLLHVISDNIGAHSAHTSFMPML